MNFEQYLSDDFLHFIELCIPPEKVFPKDSNELQLSQLWLDYLSRYQSDSLDDKRMANVYMSYLCSALAQGKLYGPFLKKPPQGKLEKVDSLAMMATQSLESFMEMPPENRAETGSELSAAMRRECPRVNAEHKDQETSYGVHNNHSRARSAALASEGQITVGSTSLSFKVSTGNPRAPSTYVASLKPCPCGKNASFCNCHRSPAGADIPATQYKDQNCPYLMPELNRSRGFLKDCDSKDSMDSRDWTTYPSHSRNSVEHCPHHTKNDSTGFSSPPMPSPLDYEQMRENIWKLLEAIKAELRGDTDPGTNDYLDHELARYKVFVMRHTNISKGLETFSNDMRMRTFLLIGFQRDLVQLLFNLMTTDGTN